MNLVLLSSLAIIFLILGASFALRMSLSPNKVMAYANNVLARLLPHMEDQEWSECRSHLKRLVDSILPDRLKALETDHSEVKSWALAASGGDVDFHGMHPLYSPLNYPPIREAYDSAFARYRMRQEEVDRIITLLEELERECNQNGDWTSPAQTRQRIDAVYDSFQAAA